MRSIKYLIVFLIFCSTIYVNLAQDFSDDDDEEFNSKRMTQSEASQFLDTYKRLFGGKDEELREDNNELGERRAEAFEAYEEKCEPVFHLGKRACPPMASCGAGFEPNVFNNYDPKKPTQAPPQAAPKPKAP